MRARIAVLCVAVISRGSGLRRHGACRGTDLCQWLVADDPGDQTINDYWERAQTGRTQRTGPGGSRHHALLSGIPEDALEMYHRALDLDKDFYEAWFRIGLVEHSRGDL